MKFPKGFYTSPRTKARKTSKAAINAEKAAVAIAQRAAINPRKTFCEDNASKYVKLTP